MKCISLVSATTGKKVETSSWLTIGRTYPVLALSTSPTGEILVRLVGDDHSTPALFTLSEFELIDTSLPTTWHVALRRDGTLVLGPKTWLRDGFWEDYFNGVPAAVKAYDNALNALRIEGV